MLDLLISVPFSVTFGEFSLLTMAEMRARYKKLFSAVLKILRRLPLTVPEVYICIHFIILSLSPSLSW